MIDTINSTNTALNSATSFKSLAKFIRDNSTKRHNNNLTVIKNDNTSVDIASTQYIPVVLTSYTYNYFTDLSPENQFTIEAYDPNDRSLSYSLVAGKDSDDFNITSNKLSFANIPNYTSPTDSDFDGEYQVDVNISNGDTFVVKTMTINVIKYNKTIKPVVSSASYNIEDDGVINYIIGSVSLSTTGDSEIIKYELTDTDSYFDVNRSTGNIYIKNTLPSIDSGTFQNQSVSIRAKNSAGWSNSVNSTIKILNAGELNSTAEIENETFETIYENNSSTQTVGTVTLVSDGGNAVTNYTISSDTSGFFRIDASGKITVSNSFDFESQNTYTISVKADNTNGLGNPATITIKIKDVNEIPTLSPSVSDQSVDFGNTKAIAYTLNDGDSGLSSKQNVTILVSSNNTGVLTVSWSESSISDNGNFNITLTSVDVGTSQITITLTDDGGTANGGQNTASFDFNATVRPTGWKIYDDNNISNPTTPVVFDNITYDWNSSALWYQTSSTILLPIKIMNTSNTGDEVTKESYNKGLNVNKVSDVEGHYYVNKNNYLYNDRLPAGNNHDVNRDYLNVEGTAIKVADRNFQHDPVHNAFVSTIIYDDQGKEGRNYFSGWIEESSSVFVDSNDENRTFALSTDSYQNTTIKIDPNNSNDICSIIYGDGWRIPTSYEMGIVVGNTGANGFIPAYVGEAGLFIKSSTQYNSTKNWIMANDDGTSSGEYDPGQTQIRCIYAIF